eukprot:jgi/Ulvmu1/3598/UM017_0010.1
MYCGWQTQAAKLRWGAVIFLITTFAALGIMYAIVSRDCVVCKSEANFVDPNSGERMTLVQLCHDYDGVRDLSDVEDCNRNFVIGSFVGFILSPILLLVPCIMMCCAIAPNDMAAHQRAAAARTAQAAATNPQQPRATVSAAPAPAPAPKKPIGKFGGAKKKKGSAAAADPLSQPAF